VIAKLLKADPTKSDRSIAETVKASPTFVGKVRAEKEAAGEVSTVDTRVDKKGVKQPAKRTRNTERPKHYREMKLGADVVAKIKGTSLDSAQEMDELIVLNRGAPEGGQTEIVKRLVADAVTGKQISAVEYTKTGAAFRREDIGPDSAGEIERIRTRNEQLENENARLRRENIALRSRVTELEAKLLDIPDFLDRTREIAS
jgi:hypothetical protein